MPTWADWNREREKKMEEKKNLLTAEGKKKYEEELSYLKGAKRNEIAQAIKEARAQGDLSENAEYQAAKDEQRLVEGRIEELEAILRNVEVVKVDESADASGVVHIGSTVRVIDVEYDEELVYTIVGSKEANTDAGKISNESPLGHALIGAAVGETVSVAAPIGEIQYKIVDVSVKG